MPNASTLQDFLEARRTGKTNIAKALDSLFTNDPSRHQADNPALVAWLRVPRALDPPLPDDPPVRTFLKGLGGGLALSDAELDHIDDWPSNQKEWVRRKLVTAIDNRRKVHFFWKLHSGDSEVTDRDDPDPQGDITITFRSPWKNVKLAASGDVTVDVG